MSKARATYVTLLFLVSAVSGCLADAGSADQQLPTTAANRVDIRSSSAKPFELDADFTAQINTPQDGRLTWKWAARDLWRQEITMGDYRQVMVRDGDTLNISRNRPFTPLRIDQLQKLLNVLSVDIGDWQVKKIKHQVEGGIETDCIEVRPQPSPHALNPKRTLCINPATKELMTDEEKDGEQHSRKEFTDYQPFGDHSYPRQLKLFANGSVALRVKISSLRESTFDQAAFIPLPGAITRRQCEHMTHPEAIKTPDPAYPRSASRLGGVATVAITILADGSVDNVEIVQSAGHEMGQAARETVKTWKFKPAMCGNEPVVSDAWVEVTFHPR